MKEELKEELVERFRAYLNTDFAQNDEEEFEDDYSLFSELSGLKNEVRIESRQFKTALDDFRDVFSTLDGVNQELAEKLKRIQSEQGEKEHPVQQKLITGLMDLYDRLQAALEQEPPKQNRFQLLFGGSRQKRWLSGHREGQEMLVQRVLNLLALCEVRPIEIRDAPFDPEKMKAIQFKVDTRRPNGFILMECRKGFIQKTQVIRPTEVVVNKIEA